MPILSTRSGRAGFFLFIFLSITVRPVLESVLNASSVLTVANNVSRVARSGGVQIGRWHHSSNCARSYTACTPSRMTQWMSPELRRDHTKRGTRRINTPTEASLETIPAISRTMLRPLQLLQLHRRWRHQVLRLCMDHTPHNFHHHRYAINKC